MVTRCAQQHFHILRNSNAVKTRITQHTSGQYPNNPTMKMSQGLFRPIPCITKLEGGSSPFPGTSSFRLPEEGRHDLTLLRDPKIILLRCDLISSSFPRDVRRKRFFF